MVATGAVQNPDYVSLELCHCVLSFHSPLSSFHDLVVATENLVIEVPLGSCLVSALRPMNPMIVN